MLKKAGQFHLVWGRFRSPHFNCPTFKRQTLIPFEPELHQGEILAFLIDDFSFDLVIFFSRLWKNDYESGFYIFES